MQIHFMKNTLSYFLFCTSIVVVCTTVSCNKKFDEPPVYEAPDITPDLTIADLKAMHVNGQLEQVTDDKIIGGVVIADDRSGQFYKTIVIQDETGGISVNLDGYDLYTKYPVGRMVYIKVKGLYLGDYNKLVEIGGGIDNSGTSPRLDDIPSALIDQYVIKGTLDNAVTPKQVKVADLNDDYQNMLIQLNDFEFSLADTSKTFADATLGSSAVNFTIKSCTGESIILRNSSYADFAGYKVPGGNGNITAIYTVFGTTKQLNIRDSSDVKFYNARCGGSGTGAVVDIATIKAFYTGSEVRLGAYKIGGVVISDATSKNISSGSIILQDKDAGIKLYFGGGASTSSFHIGDSLVVDVTGGTLQEYNGAMEISLSAAALPSAAIATDRVVIPKELTIAEITAQLPAIEYTLIKVKDATATSGTFSGNKTLTDASGSMTLYTSSAATFAADALPATAKTFTGYCILYGSTEELMIRNSSDITDGAPVPSNDTLIISEYVEGTSNNKYLEIYNAGTGDADLSKYTVKMYTNGATSAGSTAVLNTVTGLSTLPSGSSIVLKHSSAALTLPAGITPYNSGVCGFNGDDAITLEKDGTVVDVFGLVGNDPGDSWTISGNGAAAKDKTVRRKAGITHGNTDWASSSVAEWDVITTTDDVSNLGSR
jgi:predicted extracellular nuclease